MNTVIPADLTEPQWLLLRHMHQCNAPFYTDFLYEQFSKHQIDRLSFYRMFFSLATYSYIAPDGYREQQPGRKQDFRYVITTKGKRTIARYEQVKEDSRSQPLPKQRARGVIAAHLAKTVRLKDYLLQH